MANNRPERYTNLIHARVPQDGSRTVTDYRFWYDDPRRYGLTQDISGIGVPTPAEVAAGVTPASYAYPPGDTRRSNWYIEGDTAYFDPGLTPTYLTATTFSVPGDYTLLYKRNRWLKLRGVIAFVNGRVSIDPVFAAGITTVTVSMDLGGNLPTDLLAAFVQYVPNLFSANTFEASANTQVRHRFFNSSNGGAAQAHLNVGISAQSNTKGGVVFGATGSDFSGDPLSISGVTGALAFIYTNTTGVAGFKAMPIALAVGDTPRFLVGDGNTAYPAEEKVLFINAAEAFRQIAIQEPGATSISWYRSNRTTRKGIFGFSSLANDELILKNEEAGRILIQAANGNVDIAATGSCSLNGSSYSIQLSGLGNYANDAAAAAGGVPVSGWYRNGSVLQVRVV